MKRLDDWFNSLSPSERKNKMDEYIINRNRLFIVAQEKRMDYQLQSGSLSKTFGTTEDIRALRKDALRDRTAIKKVSVHLLNNSEALKKDLYVNLADIEKALPDQLKASDADLSRLFAPSVSKTGAFSNGSNMPTLNSLVYPDFSKDNITDPNNLIRFATKILLEKVGNKTFKCKSFNDVITPLSDYFNFSKNPIMARFLNELNIPQNINSRKSNDLSSWYGDPTVQKEDRERTKATCVGHAIASNATATLYKENNIKINAINKPISFNPDHIYALANNAEGRTHGSLKSEIPKINLDEYCNPTRFNADFYSGIESVNNALSLLEKMPLCPNGNGTKEMYKVSQFSSIEFKAKDTKPSFEVLKAMIDNGYPPMVGIDSDVRAEREGWLQIKPRKHFTHIVNVVGYDEGIDPWTLCPTKYFIVRDSLGQKKIHYKVSADNLLSHIDGMYSISKLHKITNLDKQNKVNFDNQQEGTY